MTSPVITKVVTKDLCIGCGICTALCPQDILKMECNRYGEYVPKEAAACISNCGLCLKVCPFVDSSENEDTIGERLYGAIPDIHHHFETGYCLATFVGYAEKNRLNGASGGLVTWLLTNLLLKDEIDAAICVETSNEPHTLFKYAVVTDVEGIESSSGSAYYPVQLSDVLRYIMTTPGRYAITALPCFAKGIRLAQMRNKVLKERIVCIIGITCGQMKSKHYTDCLAALSGVRGEVSKAHYRGKDDSYPASNFYFSCENINGDRGKIYWNEGVSEAWLNKWFTLNSCNYCDDIFAECADAVCMDAWLPEHVMDWKGTSLILIRNPPLLNAVQDGVKRGEIALASLPLDKVKQSQNALIIFKRQDLRTRLWLAEKDGRKIPKKRVSAKRNLNQIEIMKARLFKDIQIVSKERYLEWKDGNGTDIFSFQEGMERYLIKIRTLQRGVAISHIPLAVIRKLRENKS